MKQIDLMIRTLAMLRKEMTPPLTRYACILSIARHGGEVSAGKVRKDLGWDVHSTLDAGSRLGFFNKRSVTTTHGRTLLYVSLTPQGEREAARLLKLEDPS